MKNQPADDRCHSVHSAFDLDSCQIAGVQPDQGREEKKIRAIEVLYDAVASRRKISTTYAIDEFDFFGAMIRAKRIFRSSDE